MSLKKLEEKGYIELIKKGKPPKTPSKYKLVYAEKIKNREPFESVENTRFKGEREPLNEQEQLKEPPSKDINFGKLIYFQLIN